MMNRETVDIQNRDLWLKIVDMLQQNWALIEEDPEAGGVTVYFVRDGSGARLNIDLQIIIL